MGAGSGTPNATHLRAFRAGEAEFKGHPLKYFVHLIKAEAATVDKRDDLLSSIKERRRRAGGEPNKRARRLWDTPFLL